MTIDKRKDFLKSYYDKYNKLYNVSEKDFLKYYDEAEHGGYPDDPSGSIWESEGKSIYVLIRILKPKRILEIGNYKGRSTNHILQAVEKNGSGEVDLVDIKEFLEYDKLRNKNFNRILQDSVKFLDKKLDYDLYIQDGCHEYEHVKKELNLIFKNSTVDYSLWSHDYFNTIPRQCEVERAWKDVGNKFGNYYPMKDSISNCGFVLTKYNIK